MRSSTDRLKIECILARKLSVNVYVALTNDMLQLHYLQEQFSTGLIAFFRNIYIILKTNFIPNLKEPKFFKLTL